jgi:glutamyl-tRNA reductase
MASITWRLVVCGINHKSSALLQREELQIAQDQLAKANALFGGLTGVIESVIVSTCNRIEFYFVSERQYDPFDIIRDFYKAFRNRDIDNLRDNFYIRKNRHAADHLFRVAAGIDSMVLGENEILGQLKNAYSSACLVKAAGKVIHRLFHQAFRVGKQVRSDTEMGKGACSVSSAAVEMLKERIENLRRPSILFIGINRMIAQAASNLNKLDRGKFMFANRTAEKAVTFAAAYDAEGFPLESLPSLMLKADVIISCTGAKEPVITREMIDDVIAADKGKKLTIIDMAIPRDIELEENYHPNFSVFNLDDIKEFVKEQQSAREMAIPQAEEIIERRLDEFNYWYEHVRHEPMYNGLGDLFEDIRQQEISAIISGLSPENRLEVDRITRNLVKRLLKLKIRTSPETKYKE